MKKSIIVFSICCVTLFFCVNIRAYNHSSYVLMDAESGRVLYEKNKDDRFLTASIAKIMTCMVAIENGNLFEKYKVDYETISMEGSSIYLELDDEIYLYDLLCGLMLRSGNDAATLISKSVCKSQEEFVYEMNYLAREVKMSNSTFENPTGLNTNTFNYSTAYDMALLMRYAMQNEVFREISSKKTHKAITLNKTYYWNNKHKLVFNTDYVISGKTGYTKNSGRTLVSYAEINDMKLIAVSFNESGDFELHKLLFDNAVNDFKEEVVLKKGVYHQEINTLTYYPLINDDVAILIKKDSNINIKFFLLDKPKSKCGYFEIYEENKLIYKGDLYPYYPQS